MRLGWRRSGAALPVRASGRTRNGAGAMKLLVLTKRYTSAKDIARENVGRPYCLFAALRAHGHEVRFLLGDYTEKASFDIHKDGIPLRVRPLSPRRFFSFRREVSRELEERGADLLVAEGDPLFALLADRPCRTAGVPLVYDLMDNYETYAIHRIPGFRLLDRRLLRRADFVICVTDALRRRIAPVRRERVGVVGNGVDIERFKPMDRRACRERFGLPPSAPVVGYFGFLSGYKGIDLLLEAHRILRRAGFPAIVLLAGHRRGGTPVEGEGVHDLGLVAHDLIPACINACDAVAVPNPSNDYTDCCFPLKALEAAACGVPVAATALEPVRDLFGPAYPWLARPGDAGDLAAKLREACGGRGEGLRALAESHTWERLAGDLAGALAELPCTRG